jgi:hypothetical protein
VLKALALAAALEKNATLTSLRLDENEIGDEGALALAAALDKNATLTSLYINDNSSARIKHSFCETLATGHRSLHRNISATPKLREACWTNTQSTGTPATRRSRSHTRQR